MADQRRVLIRGMHPDAFESALLLILDEGLHAQEQYGDFTSMHEAWGVLAEEVDEFTREVRTKQDTPGRADRIRREAIQIAAVAMRIAEQADRVRR
jgi:hypothetical protein